MLMTKAILLLALLTIGRSALAQADDHSPFPARPDQIVDTLTLPKIFSDGMVLQRDKKLKVWGWAPAGQDVTVQFAGQNQTDQSDAKGNWNVLLDPLAASFKNRALVVSSGDQKITVDEVLVGEVWLCGGQSNMEFKMRNTRDGDMEVLSSDYPAIRYLRVPKVANTRPQADFEPSESEGFWRKCQGADTEDCTAVGYYFGRRLHQFLKVPVGLIDTSWGGTMAQHWVEHSMLESIEEMKPHLDAYAKIQQEWIAMGKAEGAEREYQNAIAGWKNAVAEWNAIKDPTKKSKRPPGQPKIKTDPITHHQPGGMLNGVVAPISGFTIRGVLFYQGENNSFGEGWKPYHKTFRKVIQSFRRAFDDPQLPFGIIQIAGWSTRRSMTYDMNHHTNVIREIQFDIWQDTPHTGLIVSFDANTSGSIHPGRKAPIGERSARWALAEVFQQKSHNNRPIEWRGPVYEKMEVVDGQCVVTFKNETAGGLRLNKGVDVGFYIAGEDKTFKIAKAKVAGDTLIIWNDAIKKPVAVRYASSNLPIGGLMNGRQLPAYPFRSDDWPLTPHQSEGSYLRSEARP
ncbi:MAG: sialate O-acetylesterase [Verrucomicrobiales bacterium]|jgi:sialate O-acetylesterase